MYAAKFFLHTRGSVLMLVGIMALIHTGKSFDIVTMMTTTYTSHSSSCSSGLFRRLCREGPDVALHTRLTDALPRRPPQEA